jgi:hypothetical protein
VTRRPKPPREGIEWDEEKEEPLLVPETDSQPFNPLDTKNLAIAVAKALLEKKARPLATLRPFRGAGIYCIYYRGSHRLYQPMAVQNGDAERPRWPLYIGKAIPPGGRRGSFTMDATDAPALYIRLGQHAESIRAADNLDVADFVCRFLVVQDLWIPLAEQLLIAHFAPIWNRLIDGFGNHDPGSGRYQGLCPRWDVLHPGRGWASRLKPRPETAADIGREVTQYLRGAAVPSLLDLENDVSGK